jgi:hypothetical protein
MIFYRGWHLDFNPRRPVTGTWKAQQRGVTMSAASQTALQNMIDQRMQDERERRAARGLL